MKSELRNCDWNPNGVVKLAQLRVARPACLPAIAAPAPARQTSINLVKSSPSSAVRQTARQIIRKCFEMNGLQSNWRSIRSNWVKPVL